MGGLSKYFVEHVSKCSCNDLVHPHSCRRAMLQNLFHFVLSNMKYYLPMALLHLVSRKLRGFHEDLLHDASWYFIQLVSGGVLNGYLIATFICIMRNFLGEFRYSTLVFAPSVLGGLLTAYLPKRVKNVEHTGIFQSLIESFLLQRGNFVTKLLASSLTLQTLVFMVCSAIVLLGKERRWHNGFWFLTPEAVPPTDASNLGLYILQGMRKYLLIGLALDSFKGLLGCIKSGHWQLRQFRLESMAWLGCYAGIYRSILCYLRGQRAINETQLRVLAAFVGGISYLCFPKLTILSYALLETGRTIGGKYKTDKRNRLGITDVIFPFALAYIIHTYVFYPKKISGLGGIIIDSTTANYGSNIRKRLQKLYPFFAENS